jgi:DNA-directed RNA polymerase subunit RPC12/RpoP
MNPTVTLTCPTCGGKLEITSEIDRFACGYCGNEHIVKRAGGIVSLAPIVDGIKSVKVGVDKTASELALKRLKDEYDVLEKRKKELSYTPGNASSYLIAGGSMILLAAILLVMYVGLGAFDITLGFILIFGIGGFGGFLIYLYRGAKERDEQALKRFEKEKAELVSRINAVKTEIERHKKIVSE